MKIPAEPNGHRLRLPPKTPDQLRDFFNNGGIESLAQPLDFLLERAGEDKSGSKLRIMDEDLEIGGELNAFWQYGIRQANSRLLVIQSNLSRVAGLYLNLPVELDAYRLKGGGSICASYSQSLGEGRYKVMHYLKNGEGPAIGDPAAAVRVQRIASRQLLRACGVRRLSELDAIEPADRFELSAA